MISEQLSFNGFERSPQTINEAVFNRYGYKNPKEGWEMSRAEAFALIMLLRELTPECAIEVGTSQGGSLSVLSRFSQKVYSLDIDQSCRERLSPHYPNTEFITGSSQKTLPLLLERLKETKESLEFVLIDGDHTRNGVYQDVENILHFHPSRMLYILIHDSFNPECRQGMLDANWTMNPYVHFVELDFIQGTMMLKPQSGLYREMWGGFALAVLLPVKRTRDLVITSGKEPFFQLVFDHSIHGCATRKRLPVFVTLLYQKIIRTLKRRRKR